MCIRQRPDMALYTCTNSCHRETTQTWHSIQTLFHDPMAAHGHGLVFMHSVMNKRDSTDMALYSSTKSCHSESTQTWHSIQAHSHDTCVLYTYDAVDDMQGVNLGGRSIMTKKTITH